MSLEMPQGTIPGQGLRDQGVRPGFLRVPAEEAQDSGWTPVWETAAPPDPPLRWRDQSRPLCTETLSPASLAMRPRERNHPFPLGTRIALPSSTSHCPPPFPASSCLLLSPSNLVCSSKHSPARPEKTICREGCHGLRGQGLDCDSCSSGPREGLRQCP